MKKVMAALAFILLLSSYSAFAEKSLSIQEAKELALKNSNLIKSAEIKVESDEINAREQLAKKDRQKNTSAPPGYGYTSVVETTLLRRGYYSDAAAVAFELSKLSREKTLNEIEYNAINAYYTLSNARESLRIKKEAVEIANQNFKAVSARLELGTASKYEYLLAESSVNVAVNDVETAQRNAELARLSFNNTLGLEPSEEIVLTDTPTVSIPEEVDLDEYIKKALENKYEVLSARMQLKLAEKEADCYEAFYTKGTYFYKLKEYNVESTKAQLENTEKSIELSIRKSYYDYLNSYTDVLSCDELVNVKQLAYDFAKSNFESGKVINSEVIKAQNELDAAKLARTQAQAKYFLTKLTFDSKSKI